MNKAQKIKEAICEPKVQIKAVTWNKDSHGLFDYESKSLSQCKFLIDSTTRIYRNSKSNEIEIRTSDDMRDKIPVDPSNAQLAQIEKRDSHQPESKFFVRVENPPAMDIESESSDGIYLIVRSLKNRDGDQKGYPLDIDDVIKLGRIEYRVSEIRTGATTAISSQSDLNSQMGGSQYVVPEGLKGVCKICLLDEDDQSNFFVAPCNCKGSCEIVHINCLKKWVESKMVVKQHMIAVSYNFTKFECEICKDPFPKTIRKNGLSHGMFVIQRPHTPYIMIESVQNESKSSKSLYVIGATPEKVRLGRSNQCQIRITDISVSREHAFIKYENDKFLIFDNSSKFGTLIKLQRDLPVRLDKVAVQIGRTVITCTIKYDEVPSRGREKSQKNLAASNGVASYRKI